MGWKDAPLVAEEKKPAWMAAPIVEAEKSGGILDYYKKDLPEIARGFWERTKKRAETLTAPTEFGEAVHAKPGGVLEAAVGVPERLGRLALGGLGSAADLVGQVPFEIAAKSANRLTGGAAGKAVGGAVNTITKPIQPAIKKLGEKVEEYRANSSPGENANLDAALSGFGGLLQFGGVKAAPKMAERVLESKPSLSKAVKPLMNERGSVKLPGGEIPDIDAFPDFKPLDEIEQAPLPKTMKQIDKNIGQPPKKGMRNYALTTEEQNFLSKPEGPNETPFPEVMQQAKLAKDKRYEGVLTPLDKAAADKGGQALKIISDKKNEIGKIKGDLVSSADDYLIQTGQFADATPIQERFKQLVSDRLGGQFNEKGQLVDAAGRIFNDSSEKALVMRMAKTLDKLRPETTLTELDDVVMDLRNMVEHKKTTQTKQIFTKADGIGETIRGDIKNLIDNHLQNSVDWGGADQFLGKNGSEKLKQALKDYANISKIEDRLNRGLGEVVDPSTGQAKMGASLLKSSLMSNSDRGTKALFRAVNYLTGIDLMKEAAKAEIAMKAVGDSRINDLLQEVGAVRSLVQGDKAGALIKLGEKGLQKWTGEKPDQLLRYYYRQQGPSAGVNTIKKQGNQPALKKLGNNFSNAPLAKSNYKKDYGIFPKPAPIIEVPVYKNVKPIAKSVEPKPVEESSFEGMEGLLTAKQNKERLGALKLLDENPAPEYPDYHPDELLTPEEFKAKEEIRLMDEATNYGKKPIQPATSGTIAANDLKMSMKRYLGFRGEQQVKRLEDLPPRKQMEINQYAHDITDNPDMKERFVEAGLITHDQTVVHPDDLIQWMNEAQKQKSRLGGME